MKKQISKKIPNIIFCRGGYMKYYRGITEDDSEILKGGKYNEEGNIGHECFNFYTCSDGKCYGFVQVKHAGNLNIDLIASDTNKFKTTDRAYIDGVTVIFIANYKVVGYYKNARAYRLMQKRENITEGGNDYYFVCDSKDAVLIEEKERENYTIPKKQKNWMGQANIFYAQKEENYKEIINLLNKLKLGIPMTENDTKKDIDNTIYLPKNIILYGPPGTGKTFNTMAYAVAIIEKKNFNEVKVEAADDYSKVKDRYENYKTTGLIDFVTFHQSYGYEEFIEGIKPQTENKQVTYNVEPGVFQKFCDIARVSGLQQNADYGFNSSPTIWKVSLKGTGKNDIRDYCLKNDCIRIGYDSEPSGMAVEDEFVSGKNILNAFINDMRVGDVVFSCYSNTSIDAIGVVAGDYEWKEESFQEYKRFRKVKWIYKTKAEKGRDILDINDGKVMTLSAVYRLNNVILSDVLKIVEGDDNEIKNQKSSVPEKKENYVFIIDEINRGNISKIFGELITLIEDTKREGAAEAMSLRLPYSNKEFSVPQNVYIIGTMNTADRSIASMDTALRRRFQFEEMMPAVELLAEIQIKDQSGNDTNIDVQSILQTINCRIEALYDREHTIGHAYYMPLKVKSDIDTLADIFKNKIIPLLQEYFYDDYEKIRLVLGDNQKEKVGILPFILRKPTKAKELFGPEVSDEIEFSGGEYTYSINNEGLFEDSKENYIPKEREAAFVGIYDIETAKKLFGHNQTDAKQAGEGQ